jgi:hypothetical protein
MRPSRVLAGLAAAGVLCACASSSSSSTAPPNGGGTSTATSPGGTSTSSPGICQFSSDSVTPSGTVEIRPLDQAAHPVTAPAMLPCYSFLQVQSGTANAKFVTFSNPSLCTLGQIPGSSSLAVLWTREPIPADYLFRLTAGQVMCTFDQPLRMVNLCGVGTMSVQGAAAATATCSQDPIFNVTVQAGLVLVKYFGGHTLLHSQQGVEFNSLTDQATPTSAPFSADSALPFAVQAKEMRLSPIPQTITFTSSAPKTVSIGEIYQVSAMGGASGNAVTLSIDSSSAATCSISGTTANFTPNGVVSSATVTYTTAGTCTIDASQAGNELYQAAPAQQQAIQVLAP